MINGFIPYLVGAIPFATLILLVHRDNVRRSNEVRAPFTDKLLRPPGESTRLKVVELDDRLTERLFWFFGACILTGVVAHILLHTPGTGSVLLVAGIILFTPSLCACFVLGRLVTRTLALRRDYNLGFVGERAIGEELNRLLAKGYQVFHDLPFEGKASGKPFNVDHVIVGQSGVFVVETKTRRKRVRKGAEDPKNIVAYDGEQLQFPWGSDNFGINQARENAEHVSAWLTKTAGVHVTAVPILALPGWSVERRGRGDVRVVSGREICSAVPAQGSLRPVFTDEEAKRIAAQLEQKCRDVSL